MRAWIEISYINVLTFGAEVALFMRAWIEISGKDLSIIAIESPSS